VIIKEINRNITFNIVLNSNIVYYVLVVDFFIPSRIIDQVKMSQKRIF